MFLISVLLNLEGTKYLFGDVTLTRTVPICGVLPHSISFLWMQRTLKEEVEISIELELELDQEDEDNEDD